MYSPLLIVHILGGIAALVSGYFALFAEKGSRLHIRSGDAFVISMAFMGGFGAYVSLTIHQPTNMAAGLASAYLAISGWLTLKRRGASVRKAEIGAFIFTLAAAVSFFALGWSRLQPGFVPRPMETAGGSFFFATIFSLFAVSDFRMLLRGGYSGVQRLVRHIWRMSVALFVASGSFFLGRSSTEPLRSTGLRARLFTNAIQATHVTAIPVLIILVLMVYWIVRVKRNKTYKRIPSKEQPTRPFTSELEAVPRAR